MIDSLVRFVRDQFSTLGFVPLHAPNLLGREQEYVCSAIESTFVSSVGAFVDRFEHDMARYTGRERCVATVNGTAALHIALILAGVQSGDLVITQPLTFVATCNAIRYCGADPIFVDVSNGTLGLSPKAVEEWLSQNAEIDEEGLCRVRCGGKIVRACVPMHTFGHPADLDGLVAVCERWGIELVEDAAESLGSLYKGKHTGVFGSVAAISFNGNKIITTGGGGMILCDGERGARAKHLTTTAKVPHQYEYVHDEIGYNYRLPNLNAAIGCAQLERLESFVFAKRKLAERYSQLFAGSGYRFVSEPDGCRSNYWLNAVICPDRVSRDALLAKTNQENVMTRPIWALMNRLPMFNDCLKGPLDNAEWLEERVVNLPSSVIPEFMQ